MILLPVLTLQPCAQQPCTLCAESVIPPNTFHLQYAAMPLWDPWTSLHTFSSRPIFNMPRCPSGTPGPLCTLFQVVCSSTWGVYIFFRISLTADGPQRARLSVPRTATLSCCLWSRIVFPSHAFCNGSQNKRPDFAKNRILDSGKKGGSCVCNSVVMPIQFLSSLQQHMEGTVISSEFPPRGDAYFLRKTITITPRVTQM